MSKRKADGSMIVEIEGKAIDVDIFLDQDLKSLRYELTSLSEIDPIESAFVLMLIAKGICNEAGVDPDVVMNDFLEGMANDSGMH
ncbi:MAG: hypothetical protein ACK58T_20885 [Phycisphaerae bacterium]